MDNKTMNSRIIDCTKDYENSFDILKRGYRTCDNAEAEKYPFLLIGINPSFPPKSNMYPRRVEPFTFYQAIVDSKTIPEKKYDYWKEKGEWFGDLCKKMAYLDLFPVQESDQSLFEKTFFNLASLRRDLLEITQDAIEEMKPRLIVHANRQSFYYWGLFPKNPWMGYDLKRVTLEEYPDLPPCCKEHNRLNRYPIYVINGFISSKERINQDQYPINTNLKGTFIIHYVMKYRNEEYKKYLYESKDWEEIWKWVKKHTSPPRI